MRLKKMPFDQFEQVMERNWAPVELAGDARPEWMRNIPGSILHKVMASGTKMPGLRYSSVLVSSGELIGGIDVYRNAPDDPVELNKDWYAVVKFPSTDGMLLVDGPSKDVEHWLSEIPERLRGAEIVAVPRKPSGT